MAGVCVSFGPVHVSHSRSPLADCQSMAVLVTAHRTTFQLDPSADNPETDKEVLVLVLSAQLILYEWCVCLTDLHEAQCLV